MGKANVIATNFTSGEISTLMRGRVDLAKYVNGARQIRNMVVRPQGPVWRRGGTQYVSSVKDHTKATRVVRFEFSNIQSYILEFGDLYVRPRTDSGAVFETASQAATGWAQSVDNEAIMTLPLHGWTTGDIVLVTGSAIPSYNGEWSIVADTVNTIVLKGTVWVGDPFATGAAQRNVIVTTPWPSTILNELSFAQSADVLWITHANYKPRKLLRLSATSWSLVEFVPVDGPYMDYNRDNIRITVTAITDSATVTCNAAMAAGANKFAVGDVNKYVEFIDQGIIKFGLITAFVSASQVTINTSDKMLLGIDPAVRIRGSVSQKLPDGGATKPAARTINPNNNAVGRNFYRPGRTATGVGPASTPPVVQEQDALDPGAVITAGGAASHSGTFLPTDVGKDVRITTTPIGNVNAWYTITGYTNSYTVTFGAALTMKTYTDPGEIVTLSPNSRVITATITSSAALFASTDVGRHIRMLFEGRWVYGKISVFTSSTAVTLLLFDSFPRAFSDASKIANNGRTDMFRMGSWYGDDVTGNYPSKITFHEQRLWFAASPAEPQTLWASRPQDFDKMSPSEMDGQITEGNAIDYTIGSNEINAITWLQSGAVLLVGTIGGEWQVRAATSITEPIAPGNISITPQTNHGSLDDCTALRVGAAVLFLQRSGRKLYELTYSYELDSWVSRDLTILSEHIFRLGTSAVTLEYQKEPISTVWVQLSNGDLACCTYVREQDVYAWHYHTIGGGGIVESIATTVAANGTENRLFMVVRRTIGATTKRYIEKLSSDHYPTVLLDKFDMVYVDSAVTYSGAATTTPTGFSHLNGATVQVLASGVYIGDKVIAGGTFTVPMGIASAKVTVGFAYNSDLEPNLIEGGSPFGTAQGKMKRTNRVQIQFYNTINFRIGRDSSALSPVHTLQADEFYTGYYSAQINSGYSREGSFLIRQDQPYPLIILNVMPEQHVNE